MARLNRYGEIELDPDPYKNLPRHFSKALEAFLLVPDFDLGTQRIDAVDFVIFETWNIDDEDLDEEEVVDQWVRAHRGADYVLETDDEGNLQVASPDGSSSPYAVIPEHMVELLVTEVLTQSSIERSARSLSVLDLTGEWMEYFIDEEKLLGHLLRAHRYAHHIVEEDHDSMLAKHAQSHTAD